MKRRLWAEAYPAVDLHVELAKAAAWLVANPANRKSNYDAFLNRWFARIHGDGRGRVLRALEVVGFGGRAAAYSGAAVGFRRDADRSAEARAQADAHFVHLKLALEAIDAAH